MATVEDNKGSDFGIFPPDWNNLTPDYLAFHGIKDGVRDFTPQVGRLSREQWFKMHGLSQSTTIDSRPILRQWEVDAYVDLEMRQLEENANRSGFTMGQTEGSRIALQDLRQERINRITGQYRIVNP